MVFVVDVANSSKYKRAVDEEVGLTMIDAGVGEDREPRLIEGGASGESVGDDTSLATTGEPNANANDYDDVAIPDVVTHPRRTAERLDKIAKDEDTRYLDDAFEQFLELREMAIQ